MQQVAQINNATSQVQAVVTPAGPLVAPAGMTFIVLADGTPNPAGQYYVNGGFQATPPAD